MKKLLCFAMLFVCLLGFGQGCAYSGVAMSGDKVVILQNDLFLLGALRKVYVCKIEGRTELRCTAQTP